MIRFIKQPRLTLTKGDFTGSVLFQIDQIYQAFYLELNI